MTTEAVDGDRDYLYTVFIALDIWHGTTQNEAGETLDECLQFIWRRW